MDFANVTLDTSSLERAGIMIAKAPDIIKRAVSLAIDRSLQSYATESVRQSAKRYFVKQKDVRQTLTLKKSYGGKMNGAVVSTGTRRELTEYAISPKRPPVKPGTFHGAVLRAGGLKPIPLAFLTRHNTAVIRDHFNGASRLRVLMSPSIPQILTNRETIAASTEKAQETFERRLQHELKRAGMML